MSRIIKYRVWWEGGTFGKDVYPARWKTGNDCIVLHDGSLALEDYEMCSISDPENYVVEQYTGLTDKAGREIYEGDIIEYTPSNAYHTFATRQSRVAWSIRGYLLWGDDGETPEDCAWISEHVESFAITVIGNIHEHPHLLAAPSKP